MLEHRKKNVSYLDAYNKSSRTSYFNQIKIKIMTILKYMTKIVICVH